MHSRRTIARCPDSLSRPAPPLASPSATPARIAKSKDSIPTAGPGKAPAALGPQDVQSCIWNLGDDFDLSVPGTCQVSLGGKFDYLDATICSNTAQVKVGN